nr:MAG TPA: hypothetical protein [Caudoviricetes sp.]
MISGDYIENMIIKKRNFANAGFFFNTQRKELV